MLELKIGHDDSGLGGMGGLDFAASIVSSLAWPLAAVIIAWFFRSQIGGLLAKVRKLTWGDKVLDFAEKLDEIEESAPMPDAQPEGVGLNANELPDPRLQQLIALSPNAAILDAWRPVELKIQELAKLITSTNPKEIQRQSTGQNIKRIYEMGFIPTGTFQTLRSLLELRNAAAHGRDVEPVDAVRFYNLTQDVMMVMSN
ncbi:hypothetical protein [Aliirhizobium smilacinae]|uniref:DUF4145 domain-containing protein n=1 Tax=Aliirhizobium smilacinae TaxID=1395944 RepID=A0A5C4X8Z6_9HYPH|nr:hypothetical protein [Rhizobium smilacinae]TNM59852.1 hypothetical protein FHP24_27140 [Rhizobium smilacinae]